MRCRGVMANGPEKRFTRCGTCGRIDYEQNEGDTCGVDPFDLRDLEAQGRCLNCTVKLTEGGTCPSCDKTPAQLGPCAECGGSLWHADHCQGWPR